jgi:putative ABC transport system permease protein
LTGKSRVAVVGSQVVTDLFGGLDPVGKQIKVNGILFQVVGVMKSQGSGGFGFSRDTTTYVPLTTAMTRLTRERVGNQQAVNTIEVSATDSNSIDTAIASVADKLAVPTD